MRLHLASEAASAARARAWLAEQLPEWSDASVSTAELLVSELVTNAVLHAHGRIEVTADWEGSSITVDVIDRWPSRPVRKAYGPDAATGRGLFLLEQLAEAWGVREQADRKAVWFRLSDREAAVDDAMPDLDAWAELGGWPDLEPGTDAQGVPRRHGQIEVQLRGLPVAVYVAAEEHHDALIRELSLLLAAGRGPHVSGRLLELAADLVRRFKGFNQRRTAQVEMARRANQPTVDVTEMFSPDELDDVQLVAAELEEVDRLAEQAPLLTQPALPEVRAMRRWYSEEVARQLRGLAPTPWSYRNEVATPTASGNER
ncbi:MAG TPA: ATP-binding protein [Mycobacteriales bacterium]|nr:ATP-binding protein [Mycobacteriales bacterium]